MKRFTFAFLCFILISPFAFPGGIVTNTNQSAAWARNFARYATTDIDGVYYNPAGLTKLSNGFHFSINNQSIFQTKTISNDLSLLQQSDFVGDVKAMVFPGVYGAFKIGKFAISVGFNPVGGGGSAEFNSGIPSVELGIASLPTTMAALGATGDYSYNSLLKGSSVYFGLQAGLSYEINDMISVFAGARYVMANNSYTGSITDISLAAAPAPLTNASVTGMADQFQGGGDAMQPIVDAGGSTLTFFQLEALGIIDANQRAQMEGGLLALGIPQASIDTMQLITAQGTYYGAATSMYTAAGALADQKLDTKQTGSGFTPIVGVNLSLMENMLNIGLKYEFKTKLQLTNETAYDIVIDAEGNTMFPDGAVTNADMPSMLAGGVDFKPVHSLTLSGGFEYYWDKNVNWDGREKLIENNTYNINLGIEYNISDNFLVSGSYGYNKSGVAKEYQQELSYSLSSSSIGFGGAWNILDNLRLNVGYVMVFYQDDMVSVSNPVSYNQTYKKDSKLFAIGLDFSF